MGIPEHSTRAWKWEKTWRARTLGWSARFSLWSTKCYQWKPGKCLHKNRGTWLKPMTSSAREQWTQWGVWFLFLRVTKLKTIQDRILEFLCSKTQIHLLYFFIASVFIGKRFISFHLRVAILQFHLYISVFKQGTSFQSGSRPFIPFIWPANSKIIFTMKVTLQISFDWSENHLSIILF